MIYIHSIEGFTGAGKSYLLDIIAKCDAPFYYTLGEPSMLTNMHPDAIEDSEDDLSNFYTDDVKSIDFDIKCLEDRYLNLCWVLDNINADLDQLSHLSGTNTSDVNVHLFVERLFLRSPKILESIVQNSFVATTATYEDRMSYLTMETLYTNRIITEYDGDIRMGRSIFVGPKSGNFVEQFPVIRERVSRRNRLQAELDDIDLGMDGITFKAGLHALSCSFLPLTIDLNEIDEASEIITATFI